MRPGGQTVVVICLVTFALSRAALAESLSRALELEEAGRFDEAATALEAALATPGNSREMLATIYAHRGLLHFANGDHEGALESLVRLLEVDPDATLPEAAPPEMAALLREAEARWSGRRLSTRVAVRVAGAGDDAEATVTVDVRNDLAELVRGARVVDGDAQLASAVGRGPFELSLPLWEGDAGYDRLVVQLIDEHGGTLLEGEPFDVHGAEGDDVAPSGGFARRRPRRDALRAPGWALVGLGAGAVVAGAVLIGVDSTPTGATRTGADGFLYEEQLDTVAGGGVLVGLGAAALVTGVVLLLVGLRRRATHEAAGGRLAPGTLAR
jgi:hypothetical protein